MDPEHVKLQVALEALTQRVAALELADRQVQARVALFAATEAARPPKRELWAKRK